MSDDLLYDDSTEIQETDEDEEDDDIIDKQFPLIYAVFSEGYAFRSLIEYFKATNKTTGKFFFGKKEIVYSQTDSYNDNMTLLNDLTIDTSRLVRYDCQIKEGQAITMGFDLAEMKTIVSTLGKNDSLRLCSYVDDIKLLIQPVSAKIQSESGQSFIRIKETDMDRVVVEGFDVDETSPNCTIPARDFSKKCQDIAKMKSDYISIKCTPSGFIFQALLDGQISGSTQEFGNPNEKSFATEKETKKIKGLDKILSKIKHRPISINKDNPPPKLIIYDQDDEFTILVNTAHIKALHKLANISNNGTVRMYNRPGLPLKIVTGFGSCGTLRIYLQGQKLAH